MNSELIDFIRQKIAAIEKEIRARDSMAKGFRVGTDKEWAQAAAMNPRTEVKPMRKTERLAASDAQSRISIKLRRELEMFNGVLEALLTVTV